MLKSTLEQWRMFKAVVDAGGFNQAAAVVHKSQSSVHHAVQKLENAIGVELFENTGRKVQLSAQGELMYRRATFLLNEAQKLEAVATSLPSRHRNATTNCCGHYFSLGFAIQRIK